MIFFKKKNNEDDDYFFRRYQLQDPPSQQEELYELAISFKEQLANGALVFQIVDDDYDWIGGYVVVSPTGIATVIKNDVWDMAELDEKDYEYLKQTAQDFYNATISCK